jgi:hypothetical protein
MYVQDTEDPGIVGFVGGARVLGPHPFRYGSERSHLLIHGEIIIRPQLVIATDTLRGTGLGGLATTSPSIDSMLSDGELVIDNRH